LLSNQDLTNVNAEELSNEIGISNWGVSQIFSLISHLGHFWSGASGDSKGGLSDITISGTVFNEYLAFEGIEELVDRFFKIQPPQIFTMQSPNKDDQRQENYLVKYNPIFHTRITQK